MSLITLEARTLESLADTRGLGAELANLLPRGSLVLLAGPLGAGKTELARAFLEARGVLPHEITSPTFGLENRYENSGVSHWDLYRLGRVPPESELGDLIHSGTGLTVLVEWPDRAPWLATEIHLMVALSFAGAERRQADLTTNSAELAQAWQKFGSR